MAYNNPMKEKLAQMTPKQKLTVVALVVIVVIIIWQAKGLFGSSAEVAPAPTIQPTAKMSAASPSAPSSPARAPENAQGGPPSVSPQGPGSTPAAAPLDDNLRQATIVGDSQFMKLQKMTEEKYIQKLNELEELKIQRQIAETNQAITTAKLATVAAEKDISDLLTKPAPAPVPTSAYANQLVGSAPLASGAPAPMAEDQEEAPKVEMPLEYSLISVSMQMGRWSAVLGFQGKLYGINVGDVLPVDGSMVTRIDKNSVILKKGDQTRKISIVASI